MTEEDKKSIEFEDVVEWKIIERMGHISSELAHDLRSPLQTIQNAVFLIERTPDNPSFYQMIRDSLDQATEILDSFRDYYKGHLLKPVKSDIQKVYEMGKLGLSIPQNVTLCEEIDKLEHFKMDPTKISKVFNKLLKNAVQAMPGGGEIKIKIKNEKDRIIASISDKGLGIDCDLQEVLFVPFESKKKAGKGLGIPTVKRIVESHGGTIWYETSLGKGTTFSFSLPKN